MDKDFLFALNKVRNTYETWILASINETYKATKNSQNNSTPLTAFILVSCAIDFVAGFFEGIDTFTPRDSGEIYKRFIKKYMPSYDPVDVYKGVRCPLAHNYTIGNDVLLTHNKPKIHNPRGPQGSRVINFENFYSDFMAGANQYFKDLPKNTDLQARFLKRCALGIAGTATIVVNQ